MRLYHSKAYRNREISIYDGNDVKSSLHIHVHQSFSKDGKHIIERRARCSSYINALTIANEWQMELYEQFLELKERNKNDG